MFSRGVDVSDFRSEYIRNLISVLRKVGLDKCSFEFYMNGDTKPLESEENRDLEKVPALLEEIKREHGLAYEIKDVTSYEVVPNVEQYIKSGGLMILKGRMDLRLGQTIMEFKIDLAKRA